MRIVITLIVGLMLASCGIAGAADFIWTEDFEGELPPYWLMDSVGDGYVDVVEEGEDGNHALYVDTWYGGYGYAAVPVSVFEGLDASQEITVSFRFFLDDSDNSQFNVIGTMFTGYVDSEGEYYCGTDDPLFSLPTGEWINFIYKFVPDGGETHKSWVNDEYKGEFPSIMDPYYPEGEDGEIAFFVGDPDELDERYGVAMWDDFRLEGTAAPVPEPGSLLALAGGLGGLILRKVRLG